MKAAILLFGFFLTASVSQAEEILSCSAGTDAFEEQYFSSACDEGFSMTPIRCGRTGEIRQVELWCKIDSIGIRVDTVTCSCD